MSPKTIELTNVGPIARLSIPMPEGGGLVRLMGTNDIGKSETIEAIDNALTGRGKIDIRRGSVQGQIDGFGLAIKLGRKTTRTGEALVESLEGRFSIEDLIQPPIKDPLAADAKRIKTLIQITGAKATPELFYSLIGTREKFEAIVNKASLDTDDIVVMADRIKRDLESAARKEESNAEHADGRARGSKEAAKDFDPKVETDLDKLQAELETAIRKSSKIEADRAAADTVARKVKRARDALEDAEADYSGPSIAEAKEVEHARIDAAAEAQNSMRDAEKVLRDAEEALRAAKTALQEATASAAQAIAVRKAAEQHESTILELKQNLEAVIPNAPTEDEVKTAQESVSKARENSEKGILAKKAKQHLVDVEKHRTEAEGHRKEADHLRTAAKGIDDVLSTLVASSGTPLRVEGGRLMMDTDLGPKTFAERSHGTRSKIALDIAIEAVGPNGVICLKQEFWEGIAPAKQIELARHVKGKGVLVLTAEASDHAEITPEIFDPDKTTETIEP